MDDVDLSASKLKDDLIKNQGRVFNWKKSLNTNMIIQVQEIKKTKMVCHISF